MSIKHILEGITNSIFVKEEVEKIAEDRMSLCKVCPHNSSNSKYEFFKGDSFYSKLRPDEHCCLCACNLHAKVRSLHTDCPINIWTAVASPQEAAKIAVVTDTL